jgi:hypothetical protein
MDMSVSANSNGARRGLSCGRVALLWRGDRAMRSAVTQTNNRLHRIFVSLSQAGIQAEPVVYAEEFEEEVRAQLVGCDGVLVWVDPLSDGKTRARLDPLLREIAATGVWVSAHPDTILKMGVKEVLHRTRKLGWGTDTHLYRSAVELRQQFAAHLKTSGPRVLKQNRGNGGQGVWKIEMLHGPARDADVRVLHARRGSMPEELRLADFIARCEPYFTDGGCVIDQPFQPRLPEGMIRCYLGKDKVVGFGHQLIKALVPPPPEGPDSEAAQPGPRIMSGADDPKFQRLRRQMEREWVPEMLRTLDLDLPSLPIIWDADFLYGPRTASGDDTFVLCEINVSSVFPIPDEAPAVIAELTRQSLQSDLLRR